jgi:hypothetical protein
MPHHELPANWESILGQRISHLQARISAYKNAKTRHDMLVDGAKRSKTVSAEFSFMDSGGRQTQSVKGVLPIGPLIVDAYLAMKKAEMALLAETKAPLLPLTPVPHKTWSVSGHRRVPMLAGPVKAGKCRWCGLEIRHPETHKRDPGGLDRRRTWHPRCADIYKVAAWGEAQRRAVGIGLQGGRCELCRQDARDARRALGPGWTRAHQDAQLEADHIVPLWSITLTNENRGCFLSSINLWCLCHRHHAEKTKREAGARAVRKRFAAEILTC